MKIGHFSAEYWFYAYWSIFGPITRNCVYFMMHIPGGKFSHFHACAILYREQQPNCKPGLDRRYRNLGKSVSQNHWQYVSIYNLQRKPDTIVSQANKSKDHQFNVEGRIVEVFLDAKEDRGASCSVWTLGLTSFWQPTAHPTCNIQQAKTGAKTQSICRNCNAWNSSSSSPMRFVAQNSPTFSEWTF